MLWMVVDNRVTQTSCRSLQVVETAQRNVPVCPFWIVILY